MTTRLPAVVMSAVLFACSSSSSSTSTPPSENNPNTDLPPGYDPNNPDLPPSTGNGESSVPPCTGTAISTDKAQHNSAIAGSTTIIFKGEKGLVQIPKPAGAGTQADTRSNGDGVMLGDDYWSLDFVKHTMKKKDGTMATAALPAANSATVLARHESDAFVGNWDKSTYAIYKVPLADAATPVVFATTPLTYKGEVVVQGKYIWIETDLITGVIARIDMTAAAGTAVPTFTPPDNKRLWTAAGENVIFQNGFVTSAACTYNEVHGTSGKLQDLPSPSGFCQFFTTFRDPGFVYRQDALSASTSYTKMDTTGFAEVKHVCGAFIDTDQATEDENFFYINDRHSGSVGDPIKAYPKF